MPSLRRSQGLFALGFVSIAAAACGSRGPLDGVDSPTGTTPDAQAPVPTTTTIPDAAPPKPTGPDLPPIVDCGICLIGECGEPILSCVTDPSCQAAFQCVLSECTGGIDSGCILKCAQSSPKGAIQLLGILQCVTGKCGEDCTDILSGLGGLGGGGGGGPTPRDAGLPTPRDAGPPRDGGAIPGILPQRPDAREPARTRAAIERAFSAWPELVSPQTAPE